MVDDGIVDISEIYNGVTETLTMYADVWVQAIREVLINMGKYVSGDLVNSLRAEIKQEDENVRLEIYASKVLIYVENGRPPFKKMPSVQEIIRWIQFRGIKPRTIKKKAINFKTNAFKNPHQFKTTKLIGVPRYKVTKGKKTNLNSYKAQQRLGFIVARAIGRDGIAKRLVVKPLIPKIVPELNKELNEVYSKAYSAALGKEIKAVLTDGEKFKFNLNI
jgi:hypothetical protein